MPEKARPNDATISLFEERKKRFKERQKQIGLANERGYRHIGRLN